MGGFNKYASYANQLVAAGRQAVQVYKKVNSMVNNNMQQSTDSAVRFVNMGERGNAISKTYGRGRRRRPRSLKLRRKVKRFRKSVLKVVRPKIPPSLLTETTSTPFSITGDTQGVASTLALKDSGVQIVLGNATMWGINLGDLFLGGGSESSYINTELGDYRPRINGVDIDVTGYKRMIANKHVVSRRYSKLSIRNDSDTMDLIFDLYECVAAQDISDLSFSTPARALMSCQQLYSQVSTGTQPVPQTKGLEPTDYANFGRFWKILKKHSVRIPAGGTEQNNNSYQTFKMHGKPHIYDGERSSIKYCIKGRTKFWMMIIDPEKMATRYQTLWKVASVYFHRNTHWKPLMGSHANVYVNQLELINATPTQ